jgi:uncharacterized DUF497 family protein
MRITYDPDKKARNIAERGLSFDDVINLDWNTAFIVRDDRWDYGEGRYRALGKIDDKLYAVVFTIRPDEFHVISFRRGNRREEALYVRNTEPGRGTGR